MANAAYRQLYIFQRLLTNQVVHKTALAQHFGITPRAIQRDISQLRTFIADQWPMYQLTYQSEYQGYTLTLDRSSVSKASLLILIKILLASRSLTTDEMRQTIDGLLALIPQADREVLVPIIKNERYYYTPVHHQQPLLTRIWELSQQILHRQTLTITYERLGHQLVSRTILPESIIFSEYYFYLVAYYPKYKTHLFFRVDRIRHVRVATTTIQRDRTDRFEDGRLRQVIQYMLSGEQTTIRFEYAGSVEAALDRFPTAKVIGQGSTPHTRLIETTAVDQGAKVWLLGQGPMVKVLAPASLVAEMRERIQQMLANYPASVEGKNG
ncbi:helix-turn-helix transcriptional regulator [Levilactobacillus acidifarinae]|uniref:WYL domain-containing protein n=1 Tax=Levilactobacillus acidifarinae DSM 19394 = JCM 15949 TaxID=1423715 RepID=A0A0R1LJY8_9LACO|nr:WYL domain-containing protein [Levilactobacillus acidifarinae]KRK95936.1 hypothetical protein FD25_GL002397 [Levilactobacillus acidifarinae DSM 19394]GEO69240.1 WYL domain-containing protein [Levilactobacillus acidifarinae]